jgi:hypothetical protein
MNTNENTAVESSGLQPKPQRFMITMPSIINKVNGAALTVGVCIVLVVAAAFTGLPIPLKALIYGLSLALAIGLAYWLLRPRVKLDEALQESHFEKFRRLEGLYNTIPLAVRTRSENLAAVREFDSQRRELERCINPTTYKFTRDDAPDCVHNLQLAFLQIAPVEFLHFNMRSIETDYRQAVGSLAYEAYLAAVMRKPTDPPLTSQQSERLLRSEATYLVNETRKQQRLRQHAQLTRQRLLTAAFRSWCANIIPLLVVVVIFLVSLSWVQTAKKDPSGTDWSVQVATKYFLQPASGNSTTLVETPVFKLFLMAAVMALSGIAGATGGMMSVMQRVQTSVPDNDPSTDLLALSDAEIAVFFAPVMGWIFACVLSLFFAGGVLKGSVFPTFDQPDAEWFQVLFNAKSLAIWLLWSFLAGFCERLVPDALDTLARQQADNSGQAAPAGARNVVQNSPQSNGSSEQDGRSKITISLQKAVSDTSGVIPANAFRPVPMSPSKNLPTTAGLLPTLNRSVVPTNDP